MIAGVSVLLLASTFIGLTNSFRLTIRSGTYCLSEGRVRSGKNRDHSLDRREENLFWCDKMRWDRNRNSRCKCINFYKRKGALAFWRSDRRRYVQMDASKGSGNEIQSNERNLKSDTNPGDKYYKYRGSICFDDSKGDRCCMEADNQYETYNKGRKGKEAKVDCGGGKHKIKVSQDEGPFVLDISNKHLLYIGISIIIFIILCNIVFIYKNCKNKYNKYHVANTVNTDTDTDIEENDKLINI